MPRTGAVRRGQHVPAFDPSAGTRSRDLRQVDTALTGKRTGGRGGRPPRGGIRQNETLGDGETLAGARPGPATAPGTPGMARWMSSPGWPIQATTVPVLTVSPGPARQRSSVPEAVASTSSSALSVSATNSGSPSVT